MHPADLCPHECSPACLNLSRGRGGGSGGLRQRDREARRPAADDDPPAQGGLLHPHELRRLLGCLREAAASQPEEQAGQRDHPRDGTRLPCVIQLPTLMTFLDDDDDGVDPLLCARARLQSVLLAFGVQAVLV